MPFGTDPVPILEILGLLTQTTWRALFPVDMGRPKGLRGFGRSGLNWMGTYAYDPLLMPEILSLPA